MARPDDSPDVYSEQDGLTGRVGEPNILEDREGNVWITSEVGLDRE